jgi:phosphoenolpyruvate carboxykinase (ATP)
MTDSFNLQDYGLTTAEIHRNLPVGALYEHAILYEKDGHIAENGSLVAYSGVKTGRSPKDKRVAKQSPSENEVWWGTVNIPLDPGTFALIRERARDYLNSASAFIVSMDSPVGTRSTGSRCVSSVLGRITRFSCVRC